MLDLTLRLAVWSAGAAIALAAVVGFAQHQRSVGDAKGAARIQKKWNEQLLEQHAAARDEQNRQEQETQRRLNTQRKVIDEQAKRLEAMVAERAALRVAGRGLRQQQDAYAASAIARAASSDTSAGQCGQTASEAIGLLSELFSEADREAEELAQAFDDSFAAGQLCERFYDALTKKGN